MFNVINTPFLDRRFSYPHNICCRPPPCPLGRVHLGRGLSRKAAVVPQDRGPFLRGIYRRFERRRNEGRKQLQSECTSWLTDYLVVDVVGKEHGGGAHGRSNRQTISST